jgi:hypothetical protein
MFSAAVNTESLGLSSVVEATAGVSPTSGWSEELPNQGGLDGMTASLSSVAANPISPRRARRLGAIVGLEASPSFTSDLSLYFTERHAPSIFASALKAPGGKLWKYTPSAVTSTGYTVAASGDLANGLLVWADGFATAANNGLKVLAGTSTTTEIKTTGLTAEASPPAGAALYVVGVQGGAADIVVNAGGNLGSTTLNFTTLGLTVGSWIWLGGGTAASPGALGFATAADRGFARVTSVAANLLTVDRRSQAWTADTGTGKTIQIFFGAFCRHVPSISADYLERTYSLELAQVRPGSSTLYTMATGCALNTATISAADQDKVTVQCEFVGADISAPSTSRATGPSTASAAKRAAIMPTSDQVRRLRIANYADETGISTDVIDWTLTITNNVQPQTQQGTRGAARLVFGKFMADLEATVVFTDEKPLAAIRNNATSAFDVALSSETGAVLLFDMPAFKLRDGALDAGENTNVKIALSTEAAADETYGYEAGLTQFAYLPAN